MSLDPLPLLPPGTPVDLDNCAREPIHLPGRIQSHGALVVARTSDLRIVQTSANIADLVPDGVDGVLAMTLPELVGAEATERLATTALEPGGVAVRVDRVQLVGGPPADAHAFVPGPGLLGVDLERASEAPADAGRVVARVTRFGARLAAATTPDEIVDVAATALRELTGLDRTWAYRFEADGHGVVVAEEHAAHLEPFLGLHFPESDIPPQARDLYRRTGLRMIHDSGQADAPLVPLVNPETGEWLDLSESGLRAVSPMHVRYLQNMGVRTSMSVPLVVGGALWGLLSAHHYGAAADVPLRVRAECELLGVMTAMQLSAATELVHTQRRAELQRAVTTVIDGVGSDDAFIDGLVADEQALLAVVGAAGAIVTIAGEQRLVGATPPPGDVDRLLAVLTTRDEDLVVTDALGADEPSLADLAEVASGVVAFPLSRRQGNWIVWLRPETVSEVTWANRDKGLVRRDPDGTLDLGERESFARWAEEVRGRSTPWTTAELDAVRDLRTALGALLIARTERLARLNDELARSNDELDAFAYAAAHDLREPVRGVEQLAEFLLEDHGAGLGEDGRGKLERILRLADRMDGLLVSLLTYAELGEATWERTRVHLPAIVDEVRELLATSIADDTTITVEDCWVEGDEQGLRQVLQNLVWNALKYTDGPATIEIGTRGLSEVPSGVERVGRSFVGDHDPVTVFVRDQGIGIPPEHHEHVFDLFRRLHGKDEFGGGSGAGLALCRRIVERHGGRIWVESTPGEGATFWFTLSPA